MKQCNNDIKVINKLLKGLKVTYQISEQHNQRSYRLDKLGSTANEHEFEYKKKMVTVTRYFAEHYKYNLQHPALRCPIIGQNTYLPPEVRKLLLYLLEM